MDAMHARRVARGPWFPAVVMAGVACLAAGPGCESDAPPPDAGPPEVTVALPVSRVVQEWDEYTGRLQPVESVEIRARVSGYVESVNFEDGQIVDAGDVLFVIDPRPYEALLQSEQANRARAEAELKLAQNDLGRVERAFGQQAASPSELDSATQTVAQREAEVQAAAARVRTAELDLEFTEVRSPITGRVGRNLVDVGNLIAGGTASSPILATVVSLDPIHCYFTVSEQEFLRYARLADSGARPSSRDAANPVQIGLVDEAGFPHRGVMDFVDNRVDNQTGTMQGRAIIENPDLLLTPGLFTKVRLLGTAEYEAVLIPDQAVGTDQSRQFVVVVDDQDNAKYRYVELGPMIDGLRVVRSGLGADESIVIEGLQRIGSGDAVSPDRVEVEAWMRRFDPPESAGASETSAPPGSAGSSEGSGSGSGGR
ncbi:MAG: efflux RND transporter periplasmic adaptor subunit [Planctomycetota bacterium]